MTRLPGAVFVVDIKKAAIAVKEARRLGVPIFAIVDTNCGPETVDYVIPANDDAIKSVQVVTRAFADAVLMGKNGLPSARWKWLPKRSTKARKN